MCGSSWLVSGLGSWRRTVKLVGWTQTWDSAPEFISRHCHFPAVWPWACCIAFLGLRFPLSMMEFITPTSWGSQDGRTLKEPPPRTWLLMEAWENYHFYQHFRENRPPCLLPHRMSSLKCGDGLACGALKAQISLWQRSGRVEASTEIRRLVVAGSLSPDLPWLEGANDINASD